MIDISTEIGIALFMFAVLLIVLLGGLAYGGSRKMKTRVKDGKSRIIAVGDRVRVTSRTEKTDKGEPKQDIVWISLERDIVNQITHFFAWFGGEKKVPLHELFQVGDLEVVH